MVLFGSKVGPSVMSLPIIKVKPGAGIDVVLMGPEVVALPTHWVGRQLVCPGDDCPACDSQFPRVFHYLGAAFERSPGKWGLGLLEMSDTTTGRLCAQMEVAGVFFKRGEVVRLSRRYTKSPLVAQPLNMTKEPGSLALNMLMLVQALAVLYQLPPQSGSQTLQEWTESVKPVLRSHLQAALRRI
jgi:hypothetical protein